MQVKIEITEVDTRLAVSQWLANQGINVTPDQLTPNMVTEGDFEDRTQVQHGYIIDPEVAKTLLKAPASQV